MEKNRESTIHIKSVGFKETEVKFHAQVRCDIGTDQHLQKEKIIKDHGITPGGNVFLVTHEFENEAAAASACAKIISFKDAPSPFGELMKHIEGIKTEGKKLIFGIRLPPSFERDTEGMHELSVFMGDLAHVNQFLTLNLKSSKSIKEILTDTTCSPIAQALGTIDILAKLSANKELPIKILDFFATLNGTETRKKEYRFIGRAIAAFHHLSFEVDLRETTEKMKGLYKGTIFKGMAKLFGMLRGMAEGLGILDIVKHGGNTTKIYFCLPPLISLEVTFFAPTAYEAFEQISTTPPTAPQ